MLTRLYPMVQFKKDTWEIDEFDCASIFLLIGSERALLLDSGFGIGDLRGAVEMVTDKPITLVISHSHGDHCGSAYQFEEAWAYEKSPLITGIIEPKFDKTLEEKNASRRDDIRLIASRQKGHLGYAYSMFNLYGYDMETMYEHVANEPKTIYHPIKDGQEFDLGDRIVTAYYAPGHAMDELIFLDHKTRTLFSGDSINYNTTMAGIPIEESIGYLRRIQSLSDQYDDIYNGHHDYRALGAPLGKDCLPNLIALAEEYLSGNYCEPALVPSFWDGQRTARMMLRRGRNFFGFRHPNEEPVYKK